MVRPIASPLGRLVPPENQQPGFEFEELPVEIITSDDLTKGMITALPRAQTPRGSFYEAKNARVSFEGIRRRDGTIEYRTKPDSNPVVAIVGMVDQSDIGKLVRITPSGMHYSQEGTAFVAFTNNAPTVLDGTLLRPSVTQYLDDLYVCGWSELLKVTDSTKTIEAVASGPGQAKHATTFADRVILANFTDEPYKIKWSANASPTDWTGASSGEENLVQTAAGLGDAITGLFTLENELVILRKRSIWIGQRQPFADAPFRFYSDVTEMGCDLPHSAARVPGGIIFADRSTNGIYFYQKGGLPKRINDATCDCFFDNLKDPDWVQATFDPETFSYILGITQTAGATTMEKFWVFSILHNAWTYDDGPACQCLSHFSFGEGIAIDALTGTIDSLTGTIDNLTSFETEIRHYKGLDTGEVIYADGDTDTDFGGTAFQLDLQSPNLGAIATRRTLTDLMLEVSFNRSGSVVLEQSKDRSTWKNTKTITLDSDTPRIGARKNLVTGNDLYWRLRATTSDVLVKSWWARLQEKGLQQT